MAIKNLALGLALAVGVGNAQDDFLADIDAARDAFELGNRCMPVSVYPNAPVLLYVNNEIEISSIDEAVVPRQNSVADVANR